MGGLCAMPDSWVRLLLLLLLKRRAGRKNGNLEDSREPATGGWLGCG